jgi:hypothetical protein
MSEVKEIIEEKEAMDEPIKEISELILRMKFYGFHISSIARIFNLSVKHVERIITSIPEDELASHVESVEEDASEDEMMMSEITELLESIEIKIDEALLSLKQDTEGNLLRI